MAGDFRLTEDGRAQRIRICEFQRLGSPTSDQPAPASSTAKVGSIPSTSFQTTLASDRYRDHRLLILYFDMTSMPVSDQLRALTSAQSFVERQMTSDDSISVLTFGGGGVRVESDFTSDRALLLKTLHSLTIGESQGLTGGTNDVSASDTMRRKNSRTSPQTIKKGSSKKRLCLEIPRRIYRLQWS